ncbi:MAG: glutathione S-transferase N-terminal domain-containing protein, partial [Bradymonadaceae bacterium]|nr:glutathione S-transferase N-terminal domain-containing protein [Lujinxingiaceae bacterium]
MGKLVEGKWRTETWVRDNEGHFQREASKFHGRVTADGSSGFAPEAGRYHLYVSLACPWAHRTLIMRRLKGLDDLISVSVVHPFMGEDGWTFDDYQGSTPDELNNASFLREIYVAADPNYTGRVTVPILWDKHKKTIVNNESREIIRMLDHEFTRFATNDIDLAPPKYRERIESTLDAIYEPINNGVYRAGFATKQHAYEEAVYELFE